MPDRQQNLAWKIADAAGSAERNFQRALGEDWIESYQNDWRVAHEVYELAFAPDRHIEFGKLKMIGRAA